MGERRKRTGPRSPETFEGALAEEMSVSAQFGLPLSVLAVLAEDEWDSDATGRVADTLRGSDLISRTDLSTLVIALPNTPPESARVVERRLKEKVPEARIGLAAFRQGDTVHDLLARARAAASLGD